ncbi:FMN-binding negative transcriptional regulator [Poseidonocella sp. HB161398]|uniref:FMN-binding negative transcriptional regulator n=1 Tax=Poseidonocella sp. HB161398 TaxID=2320855 RepID=UPI001107DD70|nr:FMN-binding negative transcriptional regulator [Poseidonocella sp. HB161398]
MYIPPHFEERDPAAIAEVLAGAPLAAVVAMTAEGLAANHLPLLAAPDGTLIGHAALANDMHRLIAEGQEVLAIFRGADGYVSANDYPGKAEHHQVVPTWNYQAVHVHGRISFSHEPQAKRQAVALLTRTHERQANGDAAWKMADAPAGYIEGMLGNIVALRIAPERVLAKSKLSQNRDAADRQGVIDGLGARGAADLARIMAGRG